MFSMMGLIHKTIHIAGADARVKLDFTKESHRFSYKVHVTCFFAYLLLGAAFVIDYVAMDSSVTLYLIGIMTNMGLHVHPHYLSLLKEEALHGILKIFFMFCLPLSFVIASALSLYYFLMHGSKHGREQLVSFQWHGYFIPSLVGFVLGLTIVSLLFLSAYLFGIGLPEAILLDRVPLFFIVQIALISKMYAIITVGFINIMLLLFPFSMHPGKMRHSNNRHKI